MQRIADYLGFGNLVFYREAVDLKVVKLQDLNTIIKLFNEHPIEGVKYLDYLDFVKAVELLNNKLHLTENGLNQLKIIKSNMNRGRS